MGWITDLMRSSPTGQLRAEMARAAVTAAYQDHLTRYDTAGAAVQPDAERIRALALAYECADHGHWQPYNRRADVRHIAEELGVSETAAEQLYDEALTVREQTAEHVYIPTTGLERLTAGGTAEEHAQHLEAINEVPRLRAERVPAGDRIYAVPRAQYEALKAPVDSESYQQAREANLARLAGINPAARASHVESTADVPREVDDAFWGLVSAQEAEAPATEANPAGPTWRERLAERAEAIRETATDWRDRLTEQTRRLAQRIADAHHGPPQLSRELRVYNARVRAQEQERTAIDIDDDYDDDSYYDHRAYWR